MPQPHYPTLDEVKALLHNQQIQEYEQEMADNAGLKLLPYSVMDPPRIQRELYLANLRTEDVVRIFQTDKEKIHLFSSACSEYWKDQPIDGEFPKGE